MTLIDTFPRAALDLVLVALLPIIAPTVGNAAAAEALALRMLDEYHPTTIRELHMAGEAIGFRLDALRAKAEAHEPGITAEQRDNARKWACCLTRSEHQVLRALAELKRTSLAEAGEATPPVRAGDPAPARRPVPTADQSPAAGPPAAPVPPASEPDDVTKAERALASAEKLLGLMKAHHKGGPPPHSQAAQQIQAQERVVGAARLKLAQARRQQSSGGAAPEQSAA
ncbi:MAG: hypothetical protein U1E70_03045 [Acetobacteraceae bacterium]